MITEVQWSELQRDPHSVAERTEQGVVRVRRRGKAPLLLLQEDESTLGAEGAATADRAPRNLFTHLDSAEIARMLGDTFPRIDLLPEDDRHRFAIDFSRAFETSAELERWNVLSQTVREWKATAAVHADPRLHRALSGPLDEDHGPVPPPEAGE
ncbi:hypothetical protein FHX42_002718 [Saccharopolyspora lacisalsi]|uniref:Prevent-host-death family protein n=1 Tax=Halosaccharopolyspora lacisalsi TaxID=1000566 RepID=A0A839E0U4_9PSEU|nr:hypothetical protein [Halosaccharopolyspora lacisalsi]MBA8825367.1 hypothetical protein [Halosaccharopolyspora lacisalsi]